MFLPLHTHVENLFQICHRYQTTSDYQTAHFKAFVTWQEVTCAYRT